MKTYDATALICPKGLHFIHHCQGIIDADDNPANNTKCILISLWKKIFLPSLCPWHGLCHSQGPTDDIWRTTWLDLQPCSLAHLSKLQSPKRIKTEAGLLRSDLFHAKICVISYKFILVHTYTSDHLPSFIPAELITIYENCSWKIIIKAFQSLFRNHYHVSQNRLKY